jgi:hypothetical protein
VSEEPEGHGEVTVAVGTELRTAEAVLAARPPFTVAAA